VNKGQALKDGFASREGRRDSEARDGLLIAACRVAREAMGAFDDNVKRNASFAALCEILEQERAAVKAVASIKSDTARGIAEKALLLDCIASAGGRAGRRREAYDIVLSMAADAIALAKAMPGVPVIARP
jgi:hypothetical protein